jgi:hypothetical protein
MRFQGRLLLASKGPRRRANDGARAKPKGQESDTFRAKGDAPLREGAAISQYLRTLLLIVKALSYDFKLPSGSSAGYLAHQSVLCKNAPRPEL